MSNRPGELEQMFQKQLNDPNQLIAQQYSYLRDMNMIPKMTLDYYLPENVEGRYNSWENDLRVSPYATSPINAFSHELQHAVDSAHDRLASHLKGKGTGSGLEQQFIDALKKIYKPTNIPLGDLNSYRSARNERQAYGVANSTYPGPYKGTPHLDATEATEQAILFDLAKRAIKTHPIKKEPKEDFLDTKLQQVNDFLLNLFKK
jgi:hypothetical protein